MATLDSPKDPTTPEDLVIRVCTLCEGSATELVVDLKECGCKFPTRKVEIFVPRCRMCRLIFWDEIAWAQHACAGPGAVGLNYEIEMS